MAIESEEKRKQLFDDISRWCDNVKATPLLRKGDIENLAGTILGEFYHVTLCCGHMVRSVDEGVVLEFYEYEDKTRGIVVGTYCQDCAKDYIEKLGAREVKDEKEC